MRLEPSGVVVLVCMYHDVVPPQTVVPLRIQRYLLRCCFWHTIVRGVAS
jgi:hypothetical protein